MANATGRVVQILGGVVDVEFPEEQIPELYEAIEVPREGKEPLVLEVEKHLGEGWVRTVAMDATDGLQRGVPAMATGAPITVPVGPATLGRIFNVLGRPIDQRVMSLRLCATRSTGPRLRSPSSPRAWKYSRPASRSST